MIKIIRKHLSLQINRRFASSSQTIVSPALLNVSHINSNKIAIIQLNSPKNHHALSMKMLTELSNTFTQMQQSYKNNFQPGVIIIKSQGKVFCSGHDLKEIASNSSKAENQGLFDLCSQVMMQIHTSKAPVIAQVDGHAAAAGFQLVAQCDLIVASSKAMFSCPGIFSGLFCTTPGIAGARAISSKKKIFEMLVTGEAISAKQALQYGLINKLVENSAELDSETIALAQQITRHSADIVGLGKAAFYEQINIHDLQKAYQYGGCVMVQNLEHQETKNGIKAFISKTKYAWKS